MAHNGCQKDALYLVYACCGASDLGDIADRAARSFGRRSKYSMGCLAGLATEKADAISCANDARKVVVVDGCEDDCAKKILDRAGIESFEHIRLTDMGNEKWRTPATPARIRAVVKEIETRFRFYDNRTDESLAG